MVREANDLDISCSDQFDQQRMYFLYLDGAIATTSTPNSCNCERSRKSSSKSTVPTDQLWLTHHLLCGGLPSSGA